MKYGLLFVGLFLGVSTLAFAKSKNKQPPADTAATTATAPIPGVPAPVSKFLNQQDLDKMTKKGLKLNVGTTPPNMEGTYILDSQTVRHKSGDFPGDYPIGHVVDLYTYTLKHKGITVDV
ncbi:MAG: hypothetical protein A3F82_10985 [Deltaproteobacteria bacterium RIFCSPLOWO2_12_FULL_44_12]|nr:MAG: hypothetical protein A3F82_10985 [Deltaproteobacteria bacterium RIFCSPLOWO2_12_FULL_44_12]